MEKRIIKRKKKHHGSPMKCNDIQSSNYDVNKNGNS